MFRFEEPTYLYLLLLLPFLAAFYLYSNYRRRKAIRKFGDPVLMAQLMPDVFLTLCWHKMYNPVVWRKPRDW